MNSAVQTLLKTLSNLETQEKQILSQMAACEKEKLGWEKDLESLLKSKQEIQLAISLLEKDFQGDLYDGPEVTSKSKKTKSSSKNSN